MNHHNKSDTQFLPFLNPNLKGNVQSNCKPNPSQNEPQTILPVNPVRNSFSMALLLRSQSFSNFHFIIHGNTGIINIWWSKSFHPISQRKTFVTTQFRLCELHQKWVSVYFWVCVKFWLRTTFSYSFRVKFGIQFLSLKANIFEIFKSKI